VTARKVTIDDVVGVGEIAVMLGVSKQRAGQLMDRRVHPEAPKSKKLARMQVWLLPEVVKYAREVLKREVRL
jgi:hypothetical protein